MCGVMGLSNLILTINCHYQSTL